MIKSLSFSALLVGSLNAAGLAGCGGEAINSEAAALCVDLVNEACQLGRRCEAEVGSEGLSSTAARAVGTCGSAFANDDDAIRSACEDIVGSGTELGELIVDNSASFLLACTDQFSCNENSLNRLGDELDYVLNNPYAPEGLLETSLDACYSSGGKNDDPDYDPEPDPEPKPDPNPEPEPEPEPELASMPWDVVLVSAVVADKKASGGNWDCCTGGNAPDVKAEIHIADMGYSTDKKSSLEPVWDQTVAEGILGSEILSGIKIKLSDVDPGNDDTVGECEFVINEADLGGGDVALDCPRDEAADQAGFLIIVRFQ